MGCICISEPGPENVLFGGDIMTKRCTCRRNAANCWLASFVPTLLFALCVVRTYVYVYWRERGRGRGRLSINIESA